MKRRNIVMMSAIAPFLLALPPDAVSQTKSLKDQLVGTWTVVSWEQVRPDGSKFRRFGDNPKGMNVFDANGNFVVLFVRADLPKLASANPSAPTPEEAKTIVGGAIGYYGTYTIDDPAKIVTLRIEASSFPNQVGMAQKRTVTSITSDELKYQNTTVLTGGQIYIVMKRAK